MTFKTFISKKKNKKLLYFVVGVVLFYLYIRKKGRPVNYSFYTPGTTPAAGYKLTTEWYKGVKHLIMNMTGYGWDPANPYGINNNWLECIEATKFDGKYYITGIRICVRWYEWEPTQGNYDTTTLNKIIAYCRERGFSLSICFWPYRIGNDGFIPDTHKVRGFNGDLLVLENTKVIGSLSSPVVNAKLFEAAKQFSAALATYDKAFYLQIGTGTSEEMYNLIVNIGAQNQQITDWSQEGQRAFQSWCNSRNKAFLKPNGGFSLDMSNDIGKEFARFTTENLHQYFENFRKGCKAGSSLPVCGFYSDAGSPQNSWLLHGNIAYIFRNADMIYGTDGNFPDDIDRKYMQNNLQLGTFPNAISCLEWDPTDIGQVNFVPGINPGIFQQSVDRAFSEGMQVAHMAMYYRPFEIRALENAFKTIHSKHLINAYSRPMKGTIEVDITQRYWTGQDFYMDAYNANKNSHIKSVANNFF